MCKGFVTRKERLPSGAIVDVVFFEDDSVDAWLHMCRDCGGDFVQPGSWCELSDEHWELQLLCPECGWEYWGVFTSDDVDIFDDVLHEGMSVMMDDYGRLVDENIDDEVSRFAMALESDALLPEDF